MPWTKRILRGTKVFARTLADGSLAADRDGRVDVKYQAQEGAKVYRAAARNLEPTGDPADDKPVSLEDSGTTAPPAETVRTGSSSAARASAIGAAAVRLAAARPASDGTVIVYTDGGSIPNPGPMGIGVVILRGRERQEIGEFLGDGTNNIAELTAIERALDALSDEERGRPVVIHADSSYAIGVVSGAYKAKKNVELIARIRRKAERFPKLRFVKVAGHAGVAENERCDQLASEALERRRR